MEDDDEKNSDRLQTIHENSTTLRLDTVSGSALAGPPAQLPFTSSTSDSALVSGSSTGSGDKLSQSVEPPSQAKDPSSWTRRAKRRTKLVKYPVIGENNVAVPTHLYKVKF